MNVHKRLRFCAIAALFCVATSSTAFAQEQDDDSLVDPVAAPANRMLLDVAFDGVDAATGTAFLRAFESAVVNLGYQPIENVEQGAANSPIHLGEIPTPSERQALRNAAPVSRAVFVNVWIEAGQARVVISVVTGGGVPVRSNAGLVSAGMIIESTVSALLAPVLPSPGARDVHPLWQRPADAPVNSATPQSAYATVPVAPPTPSFPGARLPAVVPAASTPPGQRTCLVLSIGSARGLAHVGVIRALQERGVRIDCVVGASMGAVVGGVYASAPQTPIETRMDALLDEYLRVAQVEVGRGSAIPALLLGAMTGGWGVAAGGVLGYSAQTRLSYPRFRRVLDEFFDNQRIEDISVPFATFAKAIEATTITLQTFTTGSLAAAVGTSAANPMIFRDLDARNMRAIDPGLDRTVAVPVEDACRLFPGARLIVSNVSGQSIFVSAQMNCPYTEIKPEVGAVDEEQAMINATLRHTIYEAGYRAATNSTLFTGVSRVANIAPESVATASPTAAPMTAAGPAVTVGRPYVLASNGETNLDAIQSAAELKLPTLSRCYAEGLRVDPNIRGDVAIEIVVNGGGAVGGAVTVSSTLNSGTVVENCAAYEMQRLEFFDAPLRTGTTATFVVPIHFESR